MEVVDDYSSGKFYFALTVLIIMIILTGWQISNQYVNFENCKNKEHQTCPILNCSITDYTGGDDGNNCANYAFRFDESGQKICSGSIVYNNPSILSYSF